MNLTLNLNEPDELDPATQIAISTLLASSSVRGLNRYHWVNHTRAVHILGLADGLLVAHGLVTPRAVWIDGRPLRTGHCDAVTVGPPFRGRGYGNAVLSEMEALVTAEYDIGTTSVDPDTEGLLQGRGWQRWLGTTWSRAEDRLTATPEEDGRVHVIGLTWPAEHLLGEIAIEWRDGEIW